MGISSSVGLVSGLDTDKIVSSLMNLEKVPITRLQQKQAVYQSKISSFGMLKSALSGLKTAASALKSPENFAPSFSSTTSNKDILNVSVSDSKTANQGTYTVKVKQLATSAQMTGNSFTSGTSSAGGGTLHFKTGDGNRVAVEIDPENSSLSDIAKAINSSKADVSASVVRVSENDYRLSLTAKSTGEDIAYSYQESGFTFKTAAQASGSAGETLKSQGYDSQDTALGISGTLSINGTDIALTGSESLDDIRASISSIADISASVDFDSATGKYHLSVTHDTAGQGLELNYKDGDDATGLAGLIDESATIAAEKALVTINNIDVERNSNTISDLIDGLTITLNSADTEKTVNIGVSSNHNDAKTKMESFVEAYNSAIKTINSLQSFDKDSGNAGDLLGDSTANILKSGLQRMIFSTIGDASSDVNSLSKLGISVEKTGLLSFDSGKFSTAMENNAESVKSFFTADESNLKGFAVRFDSYLEGYLDNKKGILAAKIDGYTSSSTRIDKDILALNTRLEKREESLRKQFIHLEQMLSNFSNTSNYLADQLSVISNMTSKFNSK